MAKFDHDTKKVYKPVCRVLKKETFPLPLVIVALKKKKFDISKFSKDYRLQQKAMENKQESQGLFLMNLVSMSVFLMLNFKILKLGSRCAEYLQYNNTIFMGHS